MDRLKGWARANQLLNVRSIISGIARDDPEKTKPEYAKGRKASASIDTERYVPAQSAAAAIYEQPYVAALGQRIKSRKKLLTSPY